MKKRIFRALVIMYCLIFIGCIRSVHEYQVQNKDYVLINQETMRYSKDFDKISIDIDSAILNGVVSWTRFTVRNNSDERIYYFLRDFRAIDSIGIIPISSAYIKNEGRKNIKDSCRIDAGESGNILFIADFRYKTIEQNSWLKTYLGKIRFAESGNIIDLDTVNFSHPIERRKILSDKGELELKIYAADSINYGNEVNIGLIFSNKTDKDLNIYWWRPRESVSASINHFLFFDIVDSNKDTLIYDHIGPTPKMPHELDVKTIKPGKNYQEIINLVEYYVSPEAFNKDSVNNRVWPAGTYTIQCRYEYLHYSNWTGGETLWEGLAISNEITLEVR